MGIFDLMSLLQLLSHYLCWFRSRFIGALLSINARISGGLVFQCNIPERALCRRIDELHTVASAASH